MTKAFPATVVVVAALALAGCAAPTPERSATAVAAETPAPPSPAPASPAPPSSTPSAPSAGPLAATTTVEASTEQLTLLADDGTALAQFGYLTSVEEVVAALTSAFGTAPDQVPYEGGSESPGGTDWVWDGLALRDPEGPGEDPIEANFVVHLTAAQAEGVDVVGTAGVRVGDALADLDALEPDKQSTGTLDDGTELTLYSVDRVNIGPHPSYGGSTDLFQSVMLFVESPDSTVTEIWAPRNEYGA